MSYKSLQHITNLMQTPVKSAESVVKEEIYSAESYVIADADFAQECYDIQKNLNSLESLDKSFVDGHNDLSLAVSVYNNNIRRYYKDRNFVKAFQRKFKTDPRGTEAVNHLINVMSLESEKSFLAKAWEAIKTFFRKLILAALKLVKMFANFIRGNLAKLQSKTYDELKGTIAASLKANGDKTVSYKMFKKDSYKVASVTNKGLLKSAEKFNNLASKLSSYIEGGKVSDSFLGLGVEQSITQYTVKDVIKTIMDECGSHSKNFGNTREAINVIFFGSEKQPKAAEHKISALLDEKSFEACSKQWLEGLNDLIKSGNQLSKASNGCLKQVEKYEKTLIDAKDTARNIVDNKASGKEILGIFSKVRLGMSVYQIFLRDYFWTALDYRTTIHRLAKAVSKNSKDKESK